MNNFIYDDETEKKRNRSDGENSAITSKDGRGCGKKEISFEEALAIAGKRRRHVSYANQTALHRRPPPFHPHFSSSHLPLSLDRPVSRKKEIQDIIYLYIYIYVYINNNFRFRCCDIYFETRRDDDTAENSWISRSPESANHPSIHPLLSPRPAVVLLSSLIIDPPGRSSAAELVFLSAVSPSLPGL